METRDETHEIQLTQLTENFEKLAEEIKYQSENYGRSIRQTDAYANYMNLTNLSIQALRLTLDIVQDISKRDESDE